MNYPLTPVQKRILAEAGETFTGGDDNDFGCLLSRIALKWFMEGTEAGISKAWQCFQNDPSAVDGVTYDQWEGFMKVRVQRHLENKRTEEAHARHMERTWN